MLWEQPIRRNYASDELQYEAIARAAPRLPRTNVSAAASQRFVSHWLVGALSDATGIGLHTMYRIAAFACLLAIAGVAVRLTRAFDLPLAAGVLALGLVITNPYAYRLLLIAPAMLSDGILVLGVAITLLGMIEERPWVAIGGSLIAVLGRETGIAVVGVVVVWLLFERRAAPAAVALVAPLAAFGVVKSIGESFATSDPSLRTFTVLTPISRLPGSARELIDHFGRVVIAAPTALAILASAWFVARRTPRSLAIAVILAAAVMLQPAVFNPDWVQHNETRLAALGIVPLAFAAAFAYALTPAVNSRPVSIAASLIVAVASLHHRYSWGGKLESPRLFIGVEAIASLALAALIIWQARAEHVIHSPG
jgi:hypothetical protein